MFSVPSPSAVSEWAEERRKFPSSCSRRPIQANFSVCLQLLSAFILWMNMRLLWQREVFVNNGFFFLFFWPSSNWAATLAFGKFCVVFSGGSTFDLSSFLFHFLLFLPYRCLSSRLPALAFACPLRLALVLSQHLVSLALLVHCALAPSFASHCRYFFRASRTLVKLMIAFALW